MWGVVRLGVFYEACSPRPMGEGPGVRSGFGWGFFCVWGGRGGRIGVRI